MMTLFSSRSHVLMTADLAIKTDVAVRNGKATVVILRTASTSPLLPVPSTPSARSPVRGRPP
jgi:hypothetical protein